MKLFKLLIFVLLLINSSVLVLSQINSDSLLVNLDYDNLRDNEKELQINHEIIIENTDSIEKTFSLQLLNLNSDYNVALSNNNITIPAKSQKSIILSGDVPVEEEKTFADLKVNNGSNINTYKLKTEIEPMIKLKEIILFANDKKEKEIESSNEKINDLEPGQEIKLFFNLENLYSTKYDRGEIEGSIEINLDDNDFGNEIYKELSFNLDSGDENEYELTFSIPKSAEKGDYELEVNLKAEDKNNIDYDLNWVIELEVEREIDDVRIDKINISPKKISCNLTGTIIVDVRNYGTEEQEDTRLQIKNDRLGINKYFDISLQGGKYSQANKIINYDFSIIENTNPGIYTFTATAYIEKDRAIDRRTIDLIIEKCIKEEPKIEYKETKVITKKSQEETKITTSTILNQNVTTITEIPFENTKLYFFILIGAIILIFLVIIKLIWLLL